MSENTESTPVSEEEKPRTKKVSTKAKYKALVGMDYDDKRVEAGDVVDDIPEDSLGWLLEGNYITKVN